jgi:hypothetical protein
MDDLIAGLLGQGQGEKSSGGGGGGGLWSQEGGGRQRRRGDIGQGKEGGGNIIDDLFGNLFMNQCTVSSFLDRPSSAITPSARCWLATNTCARTAQIAQRELTKQTPNHQHAAMILPGNSMHCSGARTKVPDSANDPGSKGHW